MPISYDQLYSEITNFNQRYPRPDLELILNPLSPINTQEMWQNADRKGVYFLFDANKNLLYIGKASLNSTIGRRLGTRFSSHDCRCLDLMFAPVEMLATIPLENDRAFEAPSIEEYLITKLQPPLNVVGINIG